MKNLNTNYLTKIVLFLFIPIVSFAQVGIGTVAPEGAIDLETTSMGLVYPRVALTATNVEAPVTNPDGGNLIEGTCVYNTAITTNGSNDVHTGIYCWNGSEWKPQFIRKEYQKFEQTGGCQRTTIRQSNSNPNPNQADNVTGLDNETFEPTFSGIYRVEVKTNFSAGAIQDFTSGSEDALSLATSEGAFFFTMSGTGVDIDPTSSSYDYTEGWSYTHSYSVENDTESPAIEDNIIPHFGTLTYYLYLLAGNTYTFTVSNCIYTGNNYFVGNGDSGTGQGHIGHYVPCTVEFEFIGE